MKPRGPMVNAAVAKCFRLMRLGASSRPLLLALIIAVVTTAAPSISVAEPSVFNDWYVDTLGDKSGVYAGTINDSGSILEEICVFSDGSCYWSMIVSTSCDGSIQVPMLGNTDSGAVALSITCAGAVGTTGSYRYIFSKWQDLEALMKDSARVGFAVPMKDGKFNVFRFSLTGRSDAMAVAEGVAARSAKKGGAKSDTSNVTL